jgi:hypothetical protein
MYTVAGGSAAEWHIANDSVVYDSRDGGCTWTQSFNLPDTPPQGGGSYTDAAIVALASSQHGERSYALIANQARDFSVAVQKQGSSDWDIYPVTLTGGPAASGVVRFVVAPSDPEVVYLAVGTLWVPSATGYELYRSTDAARSWELVKHSPFPGSPTLSVVDTSCAAGSDQCFTGFQGLTVDPLRAETLWSSNSSILNSTDGGTSWRTSYTPPSAMGAVAAIDVAGSGDAARVAAFGLWRLAWSVDGGETWALRDSPVRNDETGGSGPAAPESVASLERNEAFVTVSPSGSYGHSNVQLLTRGTWTNIAPRSLDCPADDGACLIGASSVAGEGYFALVRDGTALMRFQPRRGR